MTIGCIFNFGNENIEVKVTGNQVVFRTQQFGGAFITIDNLKLSKSGVVKEFPDLKGNENWREEAIKRFKERMKSYNTEKERINYVINDLNKFGYIPLYLQEDGFRPKKIKLNK